MKEAMFYEKKGKKVRCGLCPRCCIISEGQTGFCRVRQNTRGKLYSLNYGKAAAINIDSILKKPFFHFAPGTSCLSFCTVGCLWRCDFCCNSTLAIEWKEITGEELTPEKIVKMANNRKVPGIAYTYVEPLVFFEYARDIAALAKKAGLYNVFVSNGYATPEAVHEISKYLDAIVVDFKCSANVAALKKLSSVPDTKPIFDALLEYKKRKVFIEISNLIIPGYHSDADVKKLCNWIVDNLGPDIPMHFIQFFPSYKMLDAPRTPVAVLEKAYEIAKKEGLKYVYLGNVPGHKHESTYCPECDNLLIERAGIQITRFLLKKDLKCPKCGERIPIAGKNWIPKELWKM